MRHPWRSSVVLLALAALSLLGYHTYRANQFSRHLRAARQAEERFLFQGGREHLEICLRLRPKDRGTRLLAARVARRAGNYPAAAEQLDALRELGGEASPDHTLEIALLAVQRGDLAGAAEGYLRSCLQADHPQAFLILEALARGCLRVNRLNDALRLLHQLLREQPDNVIALVDRGTLREGVGLADKALEDYRAAYQAQPEYPAARLRLGQLLLHRNHPAEALPHFQHLHDRDPRQGKATLGLAQCRLALGECDEAADLLDALLAREPDNSKALFLRGRLALDAHDLGAAEGWLRRAVALRPGDQQANYQLGLCLGRLGKQPEGAHYTQRAAKIGADLKLLVRVMKKALRSPSDPEPRLQAGRICLRNGQDRQGLRWLQGALQIEPQHAPTHAALADYYAGKGRPDLAARHRQLARPLTSAGQPSGQPSR
jgi:predicted Zn-dependent protease